MWVLSSKSFVIQTTIMLKQIADGINSLLKITFDTSHNDTSVKTEPKQYQGPCSILGSTKLVCLYVETLHYL